MKLLFLTWFFFLQVMVPAKVRCVVMDMMPNAFDDQYIGCEAAMENEAPKLLEKEQSYEDFRMMWDQAAKAWARKKPGKTYSLPTGFKDEYGTAVVLYTMEIPHAIHPELNKNVSVAGQSRNYYMRNFHFKAFHFYLTRALQLLKPNCTNKYYTYRGSKTVYNVSDHVRFGQFGSSSLDYYVAGDFGKATFFNITTCSGTDITGLSNLKEEFEILIPVYEKFEKVQQMANLVTLKSTGKRCSYFNCAYFGGPKLVAPFCYFDSTSVNATIISSGKRGGYIPTERKRGSVRGNIHRNVHRARRLP
uniref:NAD(P)(+)--arginine ADP-ribosyltransferase n=1 Tax=Leptobrachium leishanense TaxID=445787 RepID=A0A8C5QQQ5_9ANUR